MVLSFSEYSCYCYCLVKQRSALRFSPCGFVEEVNVWGGSYHDLDVQFLTRRI